MIIETKGCTNCPFCYEYDMAIGYGCKADENIRGVEDSMRNTKSIKQSKQYQPITPKWCPLKIENLTIKIKDNV